jgi:hypothetical protein
MAEVERSTEEREDVRLKPGTDVPRRTGVSLNSPVEPRLVFDRL